jgi:hypothetical protein
MQRCEPTLPIFNYLCVSILQGEKDMNRFKKFLMVVGLAAKKSGSDHTKRVFFA